VVLGYFCGISLAVASSPHSTSEAGQSAEQDSIFRVHHEIWIAVLIILILATFTMSISSWWERREKILDTARLS
jgi:uncharacterized membrane protein AbrB (regulator of aidB expression)